MYSFLEPHTRFGGTMVPQSHAARILAAGWGVGLCIFIAGLHFHTNSSIKAAPGRDEVVLKFQLIN